MIVKLSSKLDAFVRRQGTLRPPPLARTTDPYWLSYADLGRLEQILAPKMPRADVGYRLQQIAVGYASQKARRAKARDLANRASSLRALADAAARIDKALKRVDEDDLIWSFEDIKFDFELLHEEADDGTVQFSDRKFEEFADAVLAQIDITREVARRLAVGAERRLKSITQRRGHKSLERRCIWEPLIQLRNEAGHAGFADNGPLMRMVDIYHKHFGIDAPAPGAVRQAVNDMKDPGA